jgi:hypothetical protein
VICDTSILSLEIEKYTWSVKIGGNPDVSYLEEELKMTNKGVFEKSDGGNSINAATDPDKQDKQDKQVLLKVLDIEWRDHFQTRKQTWSTLKTDAAFVVALVAIRFSFDNFIATRIISVLLIVIAFFGVGVTLHHNEVEFNKLTNIQTIEKILGVHPLLRGVKDPHRIIWYEVFSHKPTSTGAFILITHYMVIVFGFIYLIFGLLHLFWNLI